MREEISREEQEKRVTKKLAMILGAIVVIVILGAGLILAPSTWNYRFALGDKLLIDMNQWVELKNIPTLCSDQYIDEIYTLADTFQEYDNYIINGTKLNIFPKARANYNSIVMHYDHFGDMLDELAYQIETDQIALAVETIDELVKHEENGKKLLQEYRLPGE